MVRPINLTVISPLSTSLAVSESLLKSHALWNTIPVDEAFCGLYNAVLMDSFHAGKAKPLRTNVCSHKDAMMQRFGVTSLPAGFRLVIQGVLPYCSSAVATARSALLSEKSVLLKPCITSIPATMATLLMNPLGNYRGN